MKIKEVRERVASIARMQDNEGAHIREDRLYVDVLTAIANGVNNPTELSKAALEAKELSFTRWYA